MTNVENNTEITMQDAAKRVSGILNQSGNLSEVKSELRRTVNELREIASNLRKEFNGIGTEKCASVLEEAASKYEYAISKLNNIDTSSFVSGFDWKSLMV